MCYLTPVNHSSVKKKRKIQCERVSERERELRRRRRSTRRKSKICVMKKQERKIYDGFFL